MSAATSSAPTSSWSTAGTGSCQISVSLGTSRAEVAGDRAHVAVGQLEPGAGERVGELVGVLEEAARDLLVDRVEAQRQVGRQHRRRVRLRRRRGRRARCRPGAVLRLPLVARRPGSWSAPTRSRRGSRRSCCPTWSGVCVQVHLEAAGDRVVALAGAVGVASSRGPAPPAGRPRARGRRTRRGRRRRGSCRRCGRRRSARRSPRRSSPSGANVSRMSTRRGERVRVAVRALRVDVDQAHLDGAERVLEVARRRCSARRRATSASGPQ